MTNNALEYWTRSASLVHTDVTGTADAPFHPNVRYFVTNGAPHGGAASRTPTVTEHDRNPLGVANVQRAMLVNLDRWVGEGAEPTPSRYPRIDHGELITAAEHGERFPKIPGMRHPGRNLRPARVDYGPDFWTDGVFTIVPPRKTDRYQTRVPAFDADGNGLGGIRLPELEAPLGTSQGWNPRATEFGSPNYLTRFDGSFWAFEATERGREAIGDPRPSIEARYRTKEEYVARVRESARRLVADRILLAEDGEAYIEQAEGLAWPPAPTESAPFWRPEPSIESIEVPAAVPVF
jgi:hypothetical protein